MDPQEVKELTEELFLPQWASTGSAFKSMRQIEQTEGRVKLVDVHGNKYIDMSSMAVCTNLGYETDDITAAATKQLSKVGFLESRYFYHEERAMLLKFLSGILPDHSRFFFTESGAQAVEAAFRMARAFTGKRKILSSHRAYHGATAGAMTATGGSDARHKFVENGQGMEGIVHFIDAQPFDMTWGEGKEGVERALRYLEEMVLMEGGVAAIILEPILGASGVSEHPEGYLKGVQAICERHDIVFIIDEVMGGFGRTGKWFAHQHYGITPGIVTMAKGLTSALAPLGAVAVSKEISEFFKTNPVPYGSTYNAHPLSIAIAWAAAQKYEREQVLQNVKAMEGVSLAEMEELKASIPCVDAVRTIGLWGLIEIRIGRQPSAAEVAAFNEAMLGEGVFTMLRWHPQLRAIVVFVSPPLVIEEADLREGIRSMGRAIRASLAPLHSS